MVTKKEMKKLLSAFEQVMKKYGIESNYEQDIKKIKKNGDLVLGKKRPLKKIKIR